VDDFSLLIDLHGGTERQGPGGSAETRMALELANLDTQTPLRVLDIGCGTGASALQLVGSLDADVFAVDLSAEFIETLADRALEKSLAGRLHPMVASMEGLPFPDGEFDLIWSEGAVYNMGFAAGVSAWRRLLAPQGMLVVSEITWTTATRPQALQQYWDTHYPEIDTAAAKIAVLENCGYQPVAYFVLPESCWLDNYYTPIQACFADFLARHPDDPQALELVAMEREEIAFYNKYKHYYSYGVYIARKL
jgi:SAM-dependent methyltransferase